MEPERLLVELIRRLSGILEKAQRTQRLVQELARWPNADVGYVLESMYRGALGKHGGCLMLLDALSDFEAFAHTFQGRLADLYAFTDEEGLLLAGEWLLPSPHRLPEGSAPRVHHDLSQLTLGERRALARRANPTLLEKLLVDPDPTVIANVLNHPRLSEREVVRIAAKRPNSAEVLDVIAKHPRWAARYAVRLALVNNPYTPTRLAYHLLPSLSRPDVLELAQSPRFSPGFVSLAASLMQAEPPEETPPGLDGSAFDEAAFRGRLDDDDDPPLH